MQPNLSEAERRSEEARRTRAETLDLGDLALRELPASLGDLPDLKILHLGVNMPPASGRLERDFDREASKFTDLSPLFGLSGLQSLDLSGCSKVASLSALAGLVELESLNLQYCGQVTDLSPLARLARLRRLCLWGTNATDLYPLADLSELQDLCLAYTGVTDLSPLAGLVRLQGLDLRFCGSLTDLSSLSGLAELQSLDLQVCWSISDLSPLAGLTKLQHLNLWSTKVVDLSPLAGLAKLQSLNLWSTGVQDLSPLAALAELQNLNLSSTYVQDLSLLAGLVGLQSLTLDGCWAEPTEQLVRILSGRLSELVADKAVGVPREVLSKNGVDDCLPRLRIFLAELDFAAEAENEVKVILLGNGRVGKTQLCRRFRSEPFDESVPSTHGVQIWRDELRPRTGSQEQVFQVNWWDFGGQDIYHGTHALFLRSRAVFLILWSPHLENRDEDEENGVPLRNQPLAYWLDYVRSLAGEDSPAIVVQSQCDRFADQRSDTQRPEGFRFFQCCAYSAKTDLGRDLLEAQLREAIRYLRDRNGALQIGSGRAKVRRRLYELRTKDQKLKPGKRRHRTLTLNEFRAICDKEGGIVSWEHALDYLHQTGVVFYDASLFSDRIVLDQDWALDAVYSVFLRRKTIPWLRDCGRFTREDLAATVWQNHSTDEQKLFLGLMKSCGVCFPCGKTPQGEERYVAPDLLPSFEACGGRERVLDSWKEVGDTPALQLKYRFFHLAVIRRLMSEIGRQAGNLAEYWRYGFWLKDGWRESQILVQLVDSGRDDAPGAGVLELKAQGRDPLDLLREIRRTIRWYRIGEEPAELLALDGATVARSALAGAIDGRVLDVQGKPVQAEAFAAFFEDRKHEPASKIDINPQPQNKDDKRPEVFISYAWGDDTPEGKIRGEVVDRLYEALEKDGFRPVRDSKAIQPGDLISAFMRRLTRADLVVAVISDKYLRSPYCMDEIHGLWQKSQEDGGLMADRLVPIVLPEVKIGRLQDRAPYIRHWKVQREELQELQRELGEDFSPESQREFRLVRNFAQDVDGILKFLQDVLMPRKLDAHLDDGFEAVRGALRRRIGSS